MNNTTALITGASNGIGMELARIHAAQGGQLVLVARSADKLAELKAELEKKHNTKVYVLAMDLSKPGAALEVFNAVSSQNLTIDYLINNAGFGDFGFFHESDWEKTRQMIDLNMLTLTHLSHLFIKGMVARKKGKILNVASTASFQPGPLMAVYYATKAYVLSFSEAIANEVSDKGVTVTALCPGPTESGFQDKAAMGESKLVKGKKMPSAREVAEYGYKAMLKGRVVAVHGFMNDMMANAVRFVPRNFTVNLVRSMQEKSA